MFRFVEFIMFSLLLSIMKGKFRKLYMHVLNYFLFPVSTNKHSSFPSRDIASTYISPNKIHGELQTESFDR